MVIRKLKRVMKIYVLLTVLVHGQIGDLVAQEILVMMVQKKEHIQ